MIIYLTKRPRAFDPETITLLSDVLHTAWESAQASVALFDGHAEEARNIGETHCRFGIARRAGSSAANRWGFGTV
jgi:hypothetical protein